jgi:hypothetical protein
MIRVRGLAIAVGIDALINASTAAWRGGGASRALRAIRGRLARAGRSGRTGDREPIAVDAAGIAAWRSRADAGAGSRSRIPFGRWTARSGPATEGAFRGAPACGSGAARPRARDLSAGRRDLRAEALDVWSQVEWGRHSAASRQVGRSGLVRGWEGRAVRRRPGRRGQGRPRESVCEEVRPDGGSRRRCGGRTKLGTTERGRGRRRTADRLRAVE